jgi:site-specific recombinase XerD
MLTAERLLGFNDGVDDRRQKVAFHSLRHTFGSWLTMSGAHPRTIMELMGHSRVEQTMRYSHLAADQKQQAVADLERMLQRSSEGNEDRERISKTN